MAVVAEPADYCTKIVTRNDAFAWHRRRRICIADHLGSE